MDESTRDRGSETEADPEPHDTVRNVVLVVLDTARATSVTERTMPTLSALADAGTTFENAFAAAPWTLPSHASMFTGLYPSEHGTHGDNPFLDDSLRTLPEAFADAGYETIGVSNNTWITEEFGFDRGFERFRRGWQYVQSEHDMGSVVRGEDLREKLQATREHLFEGNPMVNALNILYSELLQPPGDDGADRSTTWLKSWLATRSDDRPFFCFCNYIEPHIEYDPPREHAERFLPAETSYEEARAIRQDPRAYDCADYDLDETDFAALRGLYRAELAYVDEQLGRLRDALVAEGYWEDTLVVVCGDHGEHVGEHGFFGHQYNLYDTLLHVPLVIHGGAFTGGGDRRDLVQLLDLPDTLLDAVGIEDESTVQSRGQSLHPDSPVESREAVYAEYVAPQPSIERLEARFGSVPDRVRAFDRQLQAVRTHDRKYVRGDDGFERLHDLETDPREETNLLEIGGRTDTAGMRRRIEETLGPFADHSAQTDSIAMQAGTRERLADLGYL